MESKYATQDRAHFQCPHLPQQVTLTPDACAARQKAAGKPRGNWHLNTMVGGDRCVGCKIGKAHRAGELARGVEYVEIRGVG